MSRFAALPGCLWAQSDNPSFFDQLSGWHIALGVVAVLLIVTIVFRYAMLVRLPLWILRHTFYRLRVHGGENIPQKGPVLFISNHVSWVDAMLIMASQNRRIRFMIWAPFTKMPFLGWYLKLLNVIPIDGASGPRSIVKALRTASEALEQGDSVCIFAEGGITRTGFLLPFQRGFEQIVKKAPAPIIPVCLDHLWGSIFSFNEGKFLWKLPKRIPYIVHVNFGTPLPADSTAFQVRHAIQKMSAESAVRRSKDRVPVHVQFVHIASKRPWRTCIVDPNGPKKSLSYAEVLAGVRILNRRLKPILKDEPMVGLWLPPAPGAVIANICVSFLRKTAVNLNYTANQDVVQKSITQCGIKHVLTSKLFLHKVPLELNPGVEFVYLEDFRKDIGTFERLRTWLSVFIWPRFLLERILGLHKHTAEDLATVIFSSGSTGDPKGIMLTHANIAANCESVIQAIDPLPQDRLFGILPFFHSFGYTVTIWLPLQVGASLLYHPNPLQPREIGELARNNKPTIFVATPTFLRSYIKRCEKDDFKTIRLLVVGAEKMPGTVADEFKLKFGVEPLEGYGCTELSPVACVNVPDFHQGHVKQTGNKRGTIGQPVPGVAAKIVDRETLADLPPGKEGLLLIYGANVMKGYLNNEELTKKKIRDGWYITGDLALLDEDGFITITGREERFAKVGGEMVPLER
ncbi:MAG: AMP-binding protein, partial [Gemmataceae bacterium]